MVDPELMAARLAREAEQDIRIAEILAAEQKTLETAGEKICVNSRSCAASIPKDATRCPACGKPQGQSASGHLSGANRGRRSNPIILNLGAAR